LDESLDAKSQDDQENEEKCPLHTRDRCLRKPARNMLDILNFHNTIFRRMAYIGMLLLLCVVICSIAFIERQLDDMLDSLVYPTCIYQARFCCGLLLSIASAIYIETYNRHASPRNFVLRYVAWLAVAFDLGLAVFILMLPTIYPG